MQQYRFASFTQNMAQHDSPPPLLTTAIVATVGVGVCFILATRYHPTFGRRVRDALRLFHPLRNQRTQIVTTTEQCRQAIEKLKK